MANKFADRNHYVRIDYVGCKLFYFLKWKNGKAAQKPVKLFEFDELNLPVETKEFLAFKIKQKAVTLEDNGKIRKIVLKDTDDKTMGPVRYLIIPVNPHESYTNDNEVVNEDAYGYDLYILAGEKGVKERTTTQVNNGGADKTTLYTLDIWPAGDTIKPKPSTDKIAVEKTPKTKIEPTPVQEGNAIQNDTEIVLVLYDWYCYPNYHKVMSPLNDNISKLKEQGFNIKIVKKTLVINDKNYFLWLELLTSAFLQKNKIGIQQLISRKSAFGRYPVLGHHAITAAKMLALLGEKYEAELLKIANDSYSSEAEYEAANEILINWENMETEVIELIKYNSSNHVRLEVAKLFVATGKKDELIGLLENSSDDGVKLKMAKTLILLWRETDDKDFLNPAKKALQKIVKSKSKSISTHDHFIAELWLADLNGAVKQKSTVSDGQVKYKEDYLKQAIFPLYSDSKNRTTLDALISFGKEAIPELQIVARKGPNKYKAKEALFALWKKTGDQTLLDLVTLLDKEGVVSKYVKSEPKGFDLVVNLYQDFLEVKHYKFPEYYSGISIEEAAEWFQIFTKDYIKLSQVINTCKEDGVPLNKLKPYAKALKEEGVFIKGLSKHLSENVYDNAKLYEAANDLNEIGETDLAKELYLNIANGFGSVSTCLNAVIALRKMGEIEDGMKAFIKLLLDNPKKFFWQKKMQETIADIIQKSDQEFAKAADKAGAAHELLELGTHLANAGKSKLALEIITKLAKWSANESVRKKAIILWEEMREITASKFATYYWPLHFKLTNLVTDWENLGSNISFLASIPMNLQFSPSFSQYENGWVGKFFLNAGVDYFRIPLDSDSTYTSVSLEAGLEYRLNPMEVLPFTLSTSLLYGVVLHESSIDFKESSTYGAEASLSLYGIGLGAKYDSYLDKFFYFLDIDVATMLGLLLGLGVSYGVIETK